MQVSDELKQAVKAEMQRQGLKTCSNQAVMGKATALVTAFDFLNEGNIAICEEYKSSLEAEMNEIRKVRNDASMQAKLAMNRLTMLKDSAEKMKKDLKIELPESAEGKTISLYSSLIREACSQGVSPDVACRSASYIMWAFFGCKDVIPQDKEVQQ